MSADDRLQKSEDYENKDILGIIGTRAKNYLFMRNYQLTSKTSASFLYASILNIIFFTQGYILYSLPAYNSAISQGSDMHYLIQKSVFMLLKIEVQTQFNINSITIIILFIIQILILLAYLLPIKSKQFNSFLSKCVIQVFSMVAYVPSIFISTENILNSQGIYLSLITLILTLLNRLVFITIHFQFSIEGQSQNALIRNPLSTTEQIIQFLSIVVFLLCKQFLYPMSLLIYFILNILFCVSQVKEYCICFNYHHQSMPKMIGILKILKISIALCYVIIIATEITLVKNNILTFIVSFFLFFANFFLIFKKYATKSIVIDSQGDTQSKKIIFIMWYFDRFRNSAVKKNQLYLSSLLKNHGSECLQLTCCCRKRDEIYDPKKNIFGSPTSQPHHDIVYIKHFFLKLLTQTCKDFPKSNQIIFLLAFYNLEILNFIPQTIQLIKQLKKKSLKKGLTFSEDYMLYCLAERCYSKINEINHVKGDLDLQKVRNFDLKILQLKDTIKFSVSTLSSLWKTICSQKYNQKNLVEICKVALEVMFKIQENYKQIKNINSVSTQLKQLMILYSKSVAHDIHLLSEIRKDIKLNAQKSNVSTSIEVKKINIFSPDTITLITSEIRNIRWASKNCYSIFGYKDRQQFLKLKINDLMPKFFSQNHDKYIKKWLQTGYSSKINKNSYLWGSTKQGYCFSLAIYIKIIPLQKQQDFALFAALQKLDINNQIICNQEGQILGCGRLFANTIKCSQKLIQDYKPNIQILLPSTFQFFLSSFYPQRKGYHQQNAVQVKRQGYFPKNLQTVVKQIYKQKQIFLSGNSRKSNQKQLLCNFLKQKMQQITVYMDGQYISFMSTVHQLPVLQNKKRKIIVFKLAGFKKNNVQKYYNELQKMIHKIQMLRKQHRHVKKSKSKKHNSNNSIKKDYFKIFLNPNRVKKILEQESQQRQAEDINQLNRLDAFGNKDREIFNERRKSLNDSFIVDQQKIIGHRKKLALNAQYQIKNQRAKYNIWKMKRLLFQEGVFSRYTYNMLLGKGNYFDSIKNFIKTQQKTEDLMQTGGAKRHQEDKDCSDDQLVSDDLTNRAQAQNMDKGPNDNQTFNSGTSSAAFISMTNNIKMFKVKLRSLNTPKLLYWLNIGLMLVILLVASFGIWLWTAQLNKTELGQIYFQKSIESTWVIDSLLMGKILTQKISHLSTYSTSFDADFQESTVKFLKSIRTIYIDLMHQILSVQLLDFAQLQKKDPMILQYLFKQIPLVQTYKQKSITNYLQTLQFIMREQDYSKQQLNIRNQKEIHNLLLSHKNCFQKNIYYSMLSEIDYYLFFGGLSAFVIMLIITIPIVYKIQSKVEEIMYLIDKISLNERRRYFLQYTVLSQQLQKLNQTDSWIQIEQIQQTRIKNMSTKNAFPQMQLGNQVSKSGSNKKSLSAEQRKIKSKFYQTIYFKIVVIYSVFIFFYCIKFIDIQVKFVNFLDQNEIFTKILTQKLTLTKQSLLFNQQLQDDLTSNIQISRSWLVEQIYASYHIASKDNGFYEDLIRTLTTGNVCQSIGQMMALNSSGTMDYLGFFKIRNNQQLIQCSQLNGGSLSKGLFATYEYIQQKRRHVLSLPLNDRIGFLKNKQSVAIEKILYYSNTMTYIIQNQLKYEAQQKKGSLVYQMGIWLLVLAAFLLLFTVAWIFIYLNIAERASYINAFLLLIPYEVLNQNPYIKLYIKNQFDYKSSVY